MNISSSVAMGSYRPAEMSIQNRAAEFTIDWRRVWDSMGLENPKSNTRSIHQKIAQEALQAVSQQVLDGKRVAQSVKNKGENIFGKLAFEKFMREGQPHIQLVAMPSIMPDITFITYTPEIRIEARMPAPSTSVIVQMAVAASSSFIDKQI